MEQQVRAIRLEAFGGAEVMQLVDTAPQAPGPGEVWLEQLAIGVNPLVSPPSKSSLMPRRCSSHGNTRD